MRLRLPYGKRDIPVDIPDKNVLGIVKPNELKLVNTSAIRDAILNPLATDRLKDKVESSDKVAIVVDDNTRPCPTKLIMPFLLENLNLPKKSITAIFACGSHEKVSDKDARNLLGMPLNYISSSSKYPNEFEYVGSTSRGTEVKLNKTYLEADFRILIGDVELHYFAGYGGGRKSILPGVSAHETIQSNHKLMFDRNCRLGNLENNPVHLDMLEAYELANVDFLVNVVQNAQRKLVGVYAGSHDAFYKCVELVDRMCKVKISEKPDIVVAAADGHPHDIDFYQAIKAIQTVIEVIKEGGVLILVCKCSNGIGSDIFYQAMQKYSSSDEVKAHLLENFVMGVHKAYYLLKALEKLNIILVSEIERNIVEHVFKLRYAKNIEAALNLAFELVGKDSNILVSPNGSTTLVELNRNKNV
ncbi:MAG: nickel-dependent lactate racemase [Candidatus Thermoplasmatota archaeon]|nr:nickel-dependent lactate racemase [Candidatus Thermoplasmatota archaeon]